MCNIFLCQHINCEIIMPPAAKKKRLHTASLSNTSCGAFRVVSRCFRLVNRFTVMRFIFVFLLEIAQLSRYIHHAYFGRIVEAQKRLMPPESRRHNKRRLGIELVAAAVVLRKPSILGQVQAAHKRHAYSRSGIRMAIESYYR